MTCYLPTYYTLEAPFMEKCNISTANLLKKNNFEYNCLNNSSNNKIYILKLLKNYEEKKVFNFFSDYKCYFTENHEDLPVQCAKLNKSKLFKWTVDNNFLTSEYTYKCSKIFVKNRNSDCLKLILHFAKCNCIKFRSKDIRNGVPENKMFNLPKLRNILLNNIIKELGLNTNNRIKNNNIVNSVNLIKKIQNRINIRSTLDIIQIIDNYLPPYKTLSCM